jgi:putative tricarboxylic transport membrane protein
MSDRLIALLLLIVCGFFYWQSSLVRRPAFAAFEALGPETFPRAVMAVLALLGVILLIRGKGSPIPRISRERFAAWLDHYRLPLISLALFTIYALAIPQAGWIPATAVYLVVMQLILKPRRGAQLAYVLVGSLAFSWLLAYVFETYLHVVLPRTGLF